MLLTNLLIIAILGLVITISIQQGRVIIANRMRYNQGRKMVKEREATAAILGLTGDAISTDISDETFFAGFIAYAVRAIQGSGAAVMTVDKDNKLQGCAIAGTFPPLRDVPEQVEQQLLAHPKKHTEFFKELVIPFTVEEIDKICGNRNYAFFHKNLLKWFPDGFARLAPRMLIAPIFLESKIVAVVIIVSSDDFDMHNITPEDGEYLVRLNEIATLSLRGIKAFRQRRDYEEQIQTAREEGMLQVSAGIIHNIGNAITVAKLTVHDMNDKLPKESEHPEIFILKEMLPRMEKEVKAGTLQKFIAEDEMGKQYFDTIKELLQHSSDSKTEVAALLTSLKSKLFHISEIIELQQRFVGELGTENMTSLSLVIEASIKIFEESCNRHGVKVETQLSEDVPQVLIDFSMMTQVFMNFIKNAVEAMDTQGKNRKNKLLKVKLYNGIDEEKGYAVAEIIDNGPGISKDVLKKIFNFGFSTKGGGKTPIIRGYGLHFCVDTVEKYGGSIKAESKVNEGTTFKILIPTEKGIA